MASRNQLQTFTLIKIVLGNCYFFLLLNHFHWLYVQLAGHKDSDIIGVRRNLYSNMAGKRGLHAWPD